MSETSHKGKRWIGVDWDRTLMTYTTWEDMNVDHGEPIEPTWERVRRILEIGEYDVKIFTARACDANYHRDEDFEVIRRVCRERLGRELEITCTKDFGCAAIWDDIAVPIGRNTGVLGMRYDHPHMAFVPADPLSDSEEERLVNKEWLDRTVKEAIHIITVQRNRGVN